MVASFFVDPERYPGFPIDPFGGVLDTILWARFGLAESDLSLLRGDFDGDLLLLLLEDLRALLLLVLALIGSSFP